MKKIFMVIFMMSLAINVYAFDRDDILFYASFDKGFDADVAKGDPKAAPHGKPEQCEGHSGKALLFENQSSGLVFDLRRNINIKQGTIAFWLSSDNWRGDDRDVFQRYFSTQGGWPEMVIQQTWYRKAVNLLLFKREEYLGGFPVGLTQSQVHTFDTQFVDGTSCVRPGVWYHIAFTWRSGEIKGYLNGKEYGVFSDSSIRIVKRGKKFCIGFPPFDAPRAFDINCDEKALAQLKEHWRSKIDDFVIIGRRLFPSQINKLCELGPLAYADQNEHDPSEISISNYPSMGFVKAVVIPGPDMESIGECKIELSMQESDFPMIQKVLQGNESGLFEGRIDTRFLEDGNYSMRALIYDHKGERISVSNSSRFEMLREEWWNNSIGLEDKVLPPWTPLQLNGDTIACWGREYRFKGRPFPAEIVSQGKQLLASPIRLLASLDGKGKKISWHEPRIYEQKETRIRRLQKGEIGTMKIEVDTSIEFDGFAVAEIRFMPVAPFDLDALFFDMAIKKEHALFMHRPHQYEGFAPKEKILFDVYRYSSVWLGDDERGMCWMAEDHEGWKIKDRAECLEFDPGKRASLFRVHLIDKRSTISKPFSIKFMYEATPVKPRPKGWRRIRPFKESQHRLWKNAYQSNVQLFGSCPWPAFSWSATPAPDSGFETWKEYRESFENKAVNIPYIVDRLRAFGIKRMPYTSMLSRARRWKDKPYDLVPEFRRYGDEWKAVPEITFVGWMQSGQLSDSILACPVSRLYRDYWTWQVVNKITDKEVLDNDHVYFDIFHARPCKHEEHGCGWVDEEGERQVSYGILGLRKLCKRIYAGVKAKKPDAILMANSPGHVNMAYAAFMDSLLGGECFVGSRLRSKSGHYSEVFPLDYARCEYTGKQFGFIPCHFSALHRQIKPNPDKKKYEYAFYRGSRELMAILMLHDSLLCPGADKAALYAIYNAHDRFGIGEEDVVFKGYWKQGDEISCSNEKIKVSYYCRPNAKIMLVLANLTARTQEAAITINPGKLGLPNADLIAIDGEGSRETQALTDFDGRNLQVSVREHDFKLILIGPHETMKESMKRIMR